MTLCKPIMRTVVMTSLLAQTACTGTTPPSQFYLLEPIAVAETSQADLAADKPVLALVPVRIPRYINRPQLVTASGKNTYHLDELHRWAESLDDNITRVMLQDLGALMPADVVSTTSLLARQAKLRLSVNILEFHIDPQHQARLVAEWHLRRGNEAVLNRHTSYQVAVDGDDMQQKIQALNQCLAQFNRDIANEASSLILSP